MYIVRNFATIQAPGLSSTTDKYSSQKSIIMDGISPDLDQSAIFSSSGFPMHFIWMIVGIAFALLIAVIIIMLVAIVYLSHKKTKLEV